MISNLVIVDVFADVDFMNSMTKIDFGVNPTVDQLHLKTSDHLQIRVLKDMYKLVWSTVPSEQTRLKLEDQFL